ncbi:hypothetical protein PHYBOEH_001118 [Phytophthora boehmeriae]|uniref:M96 mating-specific protein family n=1 Tax=Phytophthora boehmeriae TaxID=109152 RepID=A0A8T1VA43_9STRA|nr:hypothetical protein PHYBOEH_001118 [Phytophthora boehmeriae]
MSFHATACPEPHLAKELEDFDAVELFVDVDAFISSGDFDSSMLRLSPVASNSQHATEDGFKGDTSYTSEAIRAGITSRKAENAAKRRESRLRVKNARMSLQRQAKELTNQLVRLKQAKKTKQAKADRYRPATHLLWKQIAARELQERQLAEAEQRSLAEVVETRKAYIADLTDQVRKWSKVHQVRNSTKKLCSNADAEDDVLSEDDALCSAYIRELEANYSRIDDVFLECGMASLAEVGATAQSTKASGGDDGVEYYELLTKVPQPSSFREAASTMWKATEKEFFNRNSHECYVISKDPENTVAIKYCETKTRKTGEKVSLTHRFFLRRFVESGRIVHVWKRISEGTRLFRGVHFDETGWSCIRPSSDPMATGAIYEMCQRWTPVRYSSPGSSESVVDQFCEVLQDTSDKIFKDVVSSIQKLSIGNS